MSNTLKQLKRAKEIVDRYIASGCVFPRELRDCGRSDPARQQEYRDACKIKTWKYSLLGKNRYTCSDEVRDYMDENMPGWRDRVYSYKGRSSTIQMTKASDIVRRYRERGCTLPRRLNDPSRAQEYKDAVNLSTWKSALKGHNRVTCSVELREYLDENIPGWRDDHHHRSSSSTTATSTTAATPTPTPTATPTPSAITYGTDSVSVGTDGTIPQRQDGPSTTDVLMPFAAAIVLRYQQRGYVLPSLEEDCRLDPTRAQEWIDAQRLNSWATQPTHNLTPEVLCFLDSNMPGWQKSPTNNESSDDVCSSPLSSSKNNKVKPKLNPLQRQLLKAREVIQRCVQRQREDPYGNWLPRHLAGRQETPQLILEQKDAINLSEWKRAALMLVQRPEEMCETGQASPSSSSSLPWEVKSCLDRDLPGWMNIDSESPITFPPSTLCFPTSSSSYNNASSSSKPNTLSSLSTHPQIPRAPYVLLPVPVPLKKGTHIRAKPTRRKKDAPPPPTLTSSPSANQPVSHSVPPQKVSSEERKEASDDELEAEQVGVAALLQLSNSECSDASSPASLNGSQDSSYYSSDSDSDRHPEAFSLPPSVHHEGGVGTGFKRPRNVSQSHSSPQHVKRIRPVAGTPTYATSHHEEEEEKE